MQHDLSRRKLLASAASAAAGLTVAACSKPVRRVAVGGAEVQQAEAARRKNGAVVRDLDLTAGPATLDLAGTPAETWAYGGSVPGRELRIRAGELRGQVPRPAGSFPYGSSAVLFDAVSEMAERTGADPCLVEALVAVLAAPRPAWHADALCREHPEVSFFPERGESTEPAKAVCSS